MYLFLKPLLALGQVRRTQLSDHVEGPLRLGFLALLEQEPHPRLPARDVERIQAQELLAMFSRFLQPAGPKQKRHETNLILRLERIDLHRPPPVFAGAV